MSRFTEVLLVSPLADGRTWITRKEFGYDVGEEGSDDTIDVSIGFMTDFCQCPQGSLGLYTAMGQVWQCRRYPRLLLLDTDPFPQGVGPDFPGSHGGTGSFLLQEVSHVLGGTIVRSLGLDRKSENEGKRS